MAGTEIGVAYVSITAETSKIAGQVKQAFDGPVASAVTASGPSIGARLATGIGGALKTGATTAGVAAGAALGSALALGLGRLTAIDQAQAKLSGLGHSAAEVSSIMSDALASVKGTSFGLGEAASLAASAVAAGIEPGQELRRTLSDMADSAAIAGTSMGEMGLIWNQVAAKGRLMGEEIMQLQERGIPILQLLAKQLGLTAAEVQDLASKGKISFAQFRDAMESGMQGAALKMGNTVTGAFKNMTAAMGRFGAAILAPAFGKAPQVFNGITDAIDNLTPKATLLAQDFGGKVSEGFTALINKAQELKQQFSGGGGGLGMDIARESFQSLKTIVQQLVQVLSEVAPGASAIGSSLATASAQLGVGTWQVFLSVLQAAVGILQAATPVINAVGSAMSSNQSIVTAAVGAWLAFKTIPSILGNLRTGMASVNTESQKAQGIMQNVGAAYGTVQSKMTALGSTAKTAGAGVKEFGLTWRDHVQLLQAVNPGMSTAEANMRKLGSTASGVASAGLSKLSAGVSGVVSAFGGPWGVAITAAVVALTGFAQASQRADAFNKSLAQSAINTATAIDDMGTAFSKANGAINESTMAAVVGALDKMRGSMEATAATAPSLWDKIWEGGTKGELEAQHAQDAFAQSTKETIQALDDLKLSSQAIAPHMVENADAFNKWVATIDDGTEKGKLAAAALREFRKAADEARNIDFDAKKVSDGLQAIAERAGDASNDLQSLQSVFEGLGLTTVGATQATIAQYQAIDKIVASARDGAYGVEKLGNALLNMNGTLDLSKTESQNLANDMIQLGKNLQDVAVNGGDMASATENTNRALEAMAAATGLPISKIEELARGLGVLPEQITIAVAVNGLGPVAADLAAVDLNLKKIPGSVTTRMQLPGGQESVDTLTRLGFIVAQIPGSKDFQVTARTATAQTALDQILLQIGKLNLTKGEAKVFLNTASFDISKQNVDVLMGQLNAAHADPQVIAQVSAALQDFNITQDELSKIDLTKASPEVIAIIQKALTDLATVKGKTDELGKQEPKPKVSIDPDPAVEATKTIQRAIDAVHGTSVDVTVNYKSTGTPPPGGSAMGSRIGYARGGRLPHAAGGYRLPLTGPGTDTVDGFLGIGSNGAPTAMVNTGEWVVNGESSELYDAAIAALNAQDPVAAIQALMKFAPAPKGGSVGYAGTQAPAGFTDASNYHIYTVDVGEALRTVDRTQQRKCNRYARS